MSSASTMRGPNPSPMTMPSMSRALSVRAALSTLSAPIRPTRSPSATESAGKQRPRPIKSTVASSSGSLDGSSGGNSPREASVVVRRSTVACNARIRRRLVSRRLSRSTGALAAMTSAFGRTGTPSSRVRATIGVKARSFFLAVAASAFAKAAARDGSPHGSASTIASGSTEASAPRRPPNRLR